MAMIPRDFTDKNGNVPTSVKVGTAAHATGTVLLVAGTVGLGPAVAVAAVLGGIFLGLKKICK